MFPSVFTGWFLCVSFGSPLALANCLMLATSAEL